MGVCSLRTLQEDIGIIDGRQRDGLSLENRYIGYFQIESALSEFPGVVEAGVVADCIDQQNPSLGQLLKVFLSLDESAREGYDNVVLHEDVSEYIRQKFGFTGPISVQVQAKLPMTRSGKIMRSVLREWS